MAATIGRSAGDRGWFCRIRRVGGVVTVRPRHRSLWAAVGLDLVGLCARGNRKPYPSLKTLQEGQLRHKTGHKRSGWVELRGDSWVGRAHWGLETTLVQAAVWK